MLIFNHQDILHCRDSIVSTTRWSNFNIVSIRYLHVDGWQNVNRRHFYESLFSFFKSPFWCTRAGTDKKTENFMLPSKLLKSCIESTQQSERKVEFFGVFFFFSQHFWLRSFQVNFISVFSAVSEICVILGATIPKVNFGVNCGQMA